MSLNPDSQRLTTQTSVSAVTSFVLGLMSPVVLCSCLPTILTSLLAIILGHVALVKIKRSNGTLFGRWQAITGLVLGYIFFPLSLYLAPMYFNPPDFGNAAQANRNMSGLDQANLKLSSADAIASGNSPQATALASDFSIVLSAAINAAIVEDGGSDADKELDDTCKVYCQLNKDSVCFLVKVPQYRKYEDSAKDALDQFAWASGCNAVENSQLPQDARMGIGLRGLLLYGSVLTGKADSEDPFLTSGSKEVLNNFFAQDPAEGQPENQPNFSPD